MKRKEYRKAKRRSSKGRTILKIGLVLTIAAFLAVATYGVSLHKKAELAADRAYEPIQDRTPHSTANENKVQPATDNVSVLLIGVDDSEERQQGDSNSRADALLVATLNPKQKTVKLLSIPRDSYVYIPEVEYKDKITHANAYGGTKATIETVEEMLDIPIDYYVKTNFNAFIDVVDALGGVEVDVPYERIEKDETDAGTIHLMPGLQTLDGRHALALARTRKLDNDIERGKRQQMIIEAMMDQAKSPAAITKFGDVIEALGNNIKTDMQYKEMLSFLEYAKGGMPTVDTLTLEGDDDWSTGVYYWKLQDEDLNKKKLILRSHLGLISSITPDENDEANEDYGEQSNRVVISPSEDPEVN
ncbi:LCP family protein [Sporosarcina aquimarina]|uniref:LCP family protein n=1 Tax=Sporosarcina aquimarina TaxID=114975 RepID=A0ABU4G336_9BACL|nr:LCP family protein [Sporosarcina aquimarina]MDW0110777.1 LCP family protein [Sporosarcina aquimarina]